MCFYYCELKWSIEKEDKKDYQWLEFEINTFWVNVTDESCALIKWQVNTCASKALTIECNEVVKWAFFNDIIIGIKDAFLFIKMVVAIDVANPDSEQISWSLNKQFRSSGRMVSSLAHVWQAMQRNMPMEPNWKSF